MSQNYRRLSLVARLKAPTGGVEKKLSATTTRAYPNDPFAIAKIDNAVVSEARVERDAEDCEREHEGLSGGGWWWSGQRQFRQMQM